LGQAGKSKFGNIYHLKTKKMKSTFNWEYAKLYTIFSTGVDNMVLKKREKNIVI
jgi:hypothetical protein